MGASFLKAPPSLCERLCACVRVESKRMYVYPVDDAEMRRLIARERDPDLRQAYVEMLEGCIDEPLNRVWHTVWYMEIGRAHV